VTAEVFEADGRTDGNDEPHSRLSQFCQNAWWFKNR